MAALRPSPDGEATYKLSAGVVLSPLCWGGEAWLAWQVGGPGLLAVFLIALAPTGFLALTWRERLARVRRETRGFVRFLLDRDLHDRLASRRRALMDEVTALARLVPDAVLARRADE